VSGSRLVLVTGASAGIGRAVCELFARDGERVLAVARRLDRLEAVTTAAASKGTTIVPLAGDVTDGPAMEMLAARVLREHGVPDVIVANAGIGLDARFVDTTDRALHAVLETNVLGVVRTIRPFLPGMLERRSGRILIVSSIVGKRGVPHYAAYSASKFALHGMADAMRGELWGTGVTIGLVCPSSTATEFQEALLREGPPQRRVRPRRQTAEEVAEEIVKMSRSRRREKVLAAEGRLMLFLNALSPALMDRILARALNSR
jgi:short-subunit dehydrogenase